MAKIHALIVDDSAVLRQVMAHVLGQDPDFEVESAQDPIFAMRRMAKRWPDVVVLDVEMPRMDGITFLRKIMAERPTPVVMCSTLTEEGTQTTLDAIAAGAVDLIAKPKINAKTFLMEEAPRMRAAVKAAAQANVKRLMVRPPAPRHDADVILPASTTASAKSRFRAPRVSSLIGIGASTGGTQALEYLLTALPRTTPGIVIVQHMPEKFTDAFAKRLDGICELEVMEAKHNDAVIPGRALIAPGNKHMLVKREGFRYVVEVKDGPPVNRHRPSVDVLFRSIANNAPENTLGIIMTGMGDDGASGMREMHTAGAQTVAQNEETCVVYGMPKEAVERGGVDHILPLEGIPQAILCFAEKRTKG